MLTWRLTEKYHLIPGPWVLNVDSARLLRTDFLHIRQYGVKAPEGQWASSSERVQVVTRLSLADLLSGPQGRGWTTPSERKAWIARNFS